MRIGTSSLGMDRSALNNLSRAKSAWDQSNLRLSTMRRINRGSDDPAGMIDMTQLKAELVAIEKAAYNTSRAVGVIRTADSGLGQVGNLLTSIQGNLVEAAGGFLSDAELNAKQIEIDAAVEAINRIGRSLGPRDTLTFHFSPDLDHASTLEIPKVQAASLGGDSGTLSDLTSGGKSDIRSGNFATAAAIVEEARSQVLTARAELGAFERYSVETSRHILDAMEENVSASLSHYDTDVALEASEQMRSQVLMDTGMRALAWSNQRRAVVVDLLTQ